MLVFHIEVLEVKKQSLISVGSILPSGSGFYMILAVFALIGFGSYELYKRYAKQSQEEKQFKKSKKKNKR
jgi:cytochrome c biogenesis factor